MFQKKKIIVLFVGCTTPAAILSIFFSVSLTKHLGFQIFRSIANNLEFLNFALSFYIYCLCSAEFRLAFVCLFKQWDGLIKMDKEAVKEKVIVTDKEVVEEKGI